MASFVNLEIIKFFRCLDFVGHFVIKTMRVTKMNNRVLDYSQWGDLKKNIKLLKHSKYCQMKNMKLYNLFKINNKMGKSE